MTTPTGASSATQAAAATSDGVVRSSRLEQDKEEFIQQHSNYGYDGRLDGIYEHEFASRLKDAVYLDHGGAGLYTNSHLTSTHQYLSQALLLNPHSDINTSCIIDQVREQVLHYLGVNTKTHTIVFTYNTSTALNLLGSIFPFSSHSELCMMMDNHNSALGMREKLKACGPQARYSVVQPINQQQAKLNSSAAQLQCCCSPNLLHRPPPTAPIPSSVSTPSPGAIHPCLFVFPAESNFDGRIYDLNLADAAHSYNCNASSISNSNHTTASACSTNPLGFHHVGPQYRWYTLVDASKFLSTSLLDLSKHSNIDFVTMSFYKMFGFPTGLAGLIIKNSTAEELWNIGGTRSKLHSSQLPLTLAPSLSTLRSYFAGGTVNAVIADEDFHVMKSTGKLHELLEDGTIAFTSIISLPYGISLFRTLDPRAIHHHTTTLVQDLFHWLSAQRYVETNQLLCKFYGDRSTPSSTSLQFGPSLNFNFFDQQGDVIGYKTVEKIATANRIYLRSGSFCNPGACQLSFPISASQIRTNITAGYACWEDGENLGGHINGSIRISLGWSSRWEDIQRFKEFVKGEIMTIGRQKFVSNETTETLPSVTSTTSTSTAASINPTSTITPFSFTLPSYFQVATPVTPNPTTHTPLRANGIEEVKHQKVSIPSRPTYLLPSSPYVLSTLTVYPIKSCAGLPVSDWFISSSSSTGGGTLFLDREFLLLDAYGVALSQKVIPKLQLIVPLIDLNHKQLTLKAPNMQPLIIPLVDELTLSSSTNSESRLASICSLEVCGQSAMGYVYDTPHHAYITEWLTAVVGKYTCLARKSSQLHWPTRDLLDSSMNHNSLDVPHTAHSTTSSSSSPSVTPTPTSPVSMLPSPSISPVPSIDTAPDISPNSKQSPLASFSRPSFANEDDFLLVNAASVREVQRRLHEYVSGHAILRPHPNDAHISPSRFRPNFVFDSADVVLTPFAEDDWHQVTIGPFTLTVTGGCGRCVMVNVDHATGDRSSSLYALLNTCRKKDGRVLFGSLLSNLQYQQTTDSTNQTTTADEGHQRHWWPIRIGMPCSAK